jgi:hypothetical protein
MLVGTVVAPLLGLDEITVGSVAAPTRVPGATVTPGATAAKTLPIPPPVSKATNSKAINIGGLDELLNLVINSFPTFMRFPPSEKQLRSGIDADRMSIRQRSHHHHRVFTVGGISSPY